MSPINVSRRQLLAGLGALIVGVHIPVAAASEEMATLNAFVAIATDGTVTVSIPSSEMGQGVTTSMPQLVADELDATWEQMAVVHGPESKEFRIPLAPGYKVMVTGGSNSIAHWHMPLRQAGAAAREMLMAAAAARWGVEASACSTENGTVRHPDGRSATYGELALEAANQRVPKKPTLKESKDHRIIGSSKMRTDCRDKVTGSTTFGIDVRLPGMLRACSVACPVFGGRVEEVDDADCRAIPGVRDVLVFDDFVAVVADTWWPAKRGVDALKITWDKGENANLANISTRLSEALDKGRVKVAEKEGKAPATIDKADTVIEAVYEVPYLDHQAMEPLNCTVHLDGERCEVWTGSQAQTLVKEAAEDITGAKEVLVHTTFLGGGFGRRGNNDFVEQALHIATRVSAPVQLLWTREEGTRHGFYRPAFAARMRASLGDKLPEAVQFRVAGNNILHRYLPKMFWGFVSGFPLEGMLEETCPYAFAEVSKEWTDPKIPVPVGFWRSVGHSHNAFFLESFLDEVAHALKRDPVGLRRALIRGDRPRHRAVLDKAVAAAGAAPEGRAHGVALHESFGSICAAVAEVSVEGSKVKVHKFTAAVDCGPVVNPDTVKAQIMGGLIFGLSEAMGAGITIEGGRVLQSNFHDYPILRMPDAPEVEVHIMNTPGAPVGGIGEIGTPPAAPAVCNAIFAATGKRIRSLPISTAMEESA
jgi:isoquinoline 1-oxidoreductase subunit beta